MSLTIEGLEPLKDRLKAGADANLVKEILKANAAEMHQFAMRKVAVDTGTLKRSIMLSMHDDGYTWRLKPLVNYAPYVEYGTRYQTAQPFIRPAYYQQLARFKADMAKITK